MYQKRIIFIALAMLNFVPSSYAADDASKEACEQDKSAKIKTIAESENELCSLDAFLGSDFIHTSVWPGLGPFPGASQDNAHGLTDAAENHLTYTTAGKKVSSCQLELRAGVSETQSVLNLQMSVDFLLEGLGVRQCQIHAVNTEIEKNSKLLIGNNYTPISVNIAPLVVSFQNLGVKEGTQNPLYRISVINENLISGDTPVVGDKKQLASAASPSNPSNLSGVAENTIEDKPVVDTETKLTKAPDKEVVQVQKLSKQPISVKSAVVEKKPEASLPIKTANAIKPLSKDEQLKNDFLEVIQNWQRTKKTAVRERQTDILGQALAGRALVRQSDAIKWLANNHKYYEMTPSGAVVEKIEPLVAGKKYAVFAEVREKTKYMNDSSEQVIKETDDTYKVNYTIEKIGEHWLISDSALVKTPVNKSGKAVEPKTSVKPTH